MLRIISSIVLLVVLTTGVSNARKIRPTVYIHDTRNVNKPNVNIGTIGHDAHGKTTLTAAITKYLSQFKLTSFVSVEQIDSEPEEAKLGHSINATRVEYETTNRHYTHIDCPGRSNYIENMIAGTSMMDVAILVVSAEVGPMPRTREHIRIAKYFGVKHVVVYMSKQDLVDDDELIELVELEIRELLDYYGYNGDDTDIITGSALRALESKASADMQSISELLAVIEKLPLPERDSTSSPFLSIFNVESVTRNGIVVIIVSGLLTQGTLKNRDTVEIVGFGNVIKSSILGIEIFKKTSVNGNAGDQLDILLRGVRMGDIKPGMVMGTPGTLKMAKRFETTIYDTDKSITSVGIRTFISKTWNTDGKIRPTTNSRTITINSGKTSTVEVFLREQLVLTVGDKFVIRYGNKNVGAGEVAKILY